MSLDNTAIVQKITNDILSADDGILAMSIMDIKGNILAAKSKESFKEKFGVIRDGEKYGGILAIATLSLVNELKDIVGETQKIITVHNSCKLMLLPIPSYQILVGLVFHSSFNAEDDYITNKIEKLLAAAVIE